MDKNRISATAILLGTLALVFTMVLHPVGGNIEHLRSISTLGIVTHSVAIASVPILIFGFLGLTRLQSNNWGDFAFVVFCTAGVATVVAAAMNGLVLPSYISRFPDPDETTLEQMKMILTYNSMVNHAFDWILMAGFALSVLFWSFSILQSRIFPKWVGYFGVLDGLLGLYTLFSGTLGVGLHEFRLFVFGFVAWTIVIGVSIWKLKSSSE